MKKGQMEMEKCEHDEKEKKKKWIGQILWIALLLSAIDSFDGYAEMEKQETQVIIWLPEEEAVPEERYIDENGQEYWLKSCQQVERLMPEYQESISEVRIYTGLEESGQIPESILAEIPDETGGRVGTGQLNHQKTAMVAQYWSDDFSVPVIFYDYDADQFIFQELEVPKGEEFQFLLENQDLFLQGIGCSPENYEIQEITWEGESYLNQGILCRNARAQGRKRVADYQSEFQGVVRYPETIKTEWEAVYEPAPKPVLEIPQKVTEPETAETAESAQATEMHLTVPGSEPEKAEFWQIIRTLALYTVSFAVLLPVLVYLVLLIWRKRKRLKFLHHKGIIKEQS